MSASLHIPPHRKRISRFLGILCICAPLFAGCADVVAAEVTAPPCCDVGIIMYHSVRKDPARTDKYVILKTVVYRMNDELQQRKQAQ